MEMLPPYKCLVDSNRLPVLLGLSSHNKKFARNLGFLHLAKQLLLQA